MINWFDQPNMHPSLSVPGVHFSSNVKFESLDLHVSLVGGGPNPPNIKNLFWKNQEVDLSHLSGGVPLGDNSFHVIFFRPIFQIEFDINPNDTDPPSKLGISSVLKMITEDSGVLLE